MLPLTLACLGLQATAFAPELQAPRAVDVGVVSALWHPDGRALLYAKDTEGGTALGVYALGEREGQVALGVVRGDEWNVRWFPGQETALVTVSRHAPSGDTLSVYLIGARAKEAREVFSRVAPPGIRLSATAYLSPSLLHAIVVLERGDARASYVLPLGGGRLVAAPDLDEAERRGLQGPAWTRDGTAAYVDGTLYFTVEVKTAIDGLLEAVPPTDPSRSNRGSAEASKADLATMAQMYSVVVNLPPSPRTSLHGGESAEGASLAIGDSRMDAPSPGKATLEVVPTNGVLRPVRSPGPWVAEPALEPRFATEPTDLGVAGDGLSERSRGLSLVGEGRGGAWRALVSPRAQWGLLAPGERAVAYATDGALFVRTLTRR